MVTIVKQAFKIHSGVSYSFDHSMYADWLRKSIDKPMLVPKSMIIDELVEATKRRELAHLDSLSDKQKKELHKRAG